MSGGNGFVDKQNGEIFTLQGNVHATFYLDCPSWWPEHGSCSVLMVPTPPVISCYSDLVPHHQPGQGPNQIIAVIKLTFFILIRYLGTCCDETVGLTCHHDHMCRNKQGVLVPLAIKFRKPQDDIVLCWFLESSVHL